MCCQGASNRFWVVSEACLARSGNKWFGLNRRLQVLLRQFHSNYRWVLNYVACQFNCCLGNSKGIIRGAGPEVSSFHGCLFVKSRAGLCYIATARAHPCLVLVWNAVVLEGRPVANWLVFVFISSSENGSCGERFNAVPFRGSIYSFDFTENLIKTYCSGSARFQ